MSLAQFCKLFTHFYRDFCIQSNLFLSLYATCASNLYSISYSFTQATLLCSDLTFNVSQLIGVPRTCFILLVPTFLYRRSRIPKVLDVFDDQYI